MRLISNDAAGKYRGTITLLAYGASFITFVVHGATSHDWHDAARLGAYIALIGLVLIALVHILEGTLVFYAPPGQYNCGFMSAASTAMIPAAALVWADHDGWAWLWFVNWYGLALLFYKTLWLEFSRLAEINVTPVNVELWSNFMRVVRWATVGTGVMFLVLKLNDAPKQVIIAAALINWAVSLPAITKEYSLLRNAERRRARSY